MLSRVLTPVAVLVAVAAVWSPATAEAAATHHALRVQITNSGLVYAGKPVTTLRAAPGDTVTWDNQSTAVYRVTVGTGGKTAYDSGFVIPTTSTSPYSVSAGVHPVSATSPSNRAFSMTISATAPTAGPSPTATKAGGAQPAPSAPASRPPRVAPAPATPRVKAARPAPLPPFPLPPSTGAVQRQPGRHPVLAAPTIPRLPVVPAPRPRATGLTAGPIEPASIRGLGTSATLAAVLLAGLVAGLVRVLLAEPVDGRRGVVGGRA